MRPSKVWGPGQEPLLLRSKGRAVPTSTFLPPDLQNNPHPLHSTQHDRKCDTNFTKTWECVEHILRTLPGLGTDYASEGLPQCHNELPLGNVQQSSGDLAH